MGAKEKADALESNIIRGMQAAYQKMVEFKKYKKSPLIISKNGKIVEIPSEQIPASIKYKVGE